jgi:DNA-binding protein HU-beta
LNRSDLIAEVSERTNIAQEDVRVVLYALLGAIADEMQRGGYLLLPNFGSFSVRRYPGKTTPLPDGTWHVRAPLTRVFFKPGTRLKDYVNFKIDEITFDWTGTSKKSD